MEGKFILNFTLVEKPTTYLSLLISENLLLIVLVCIKSEPHVTQITI